MSEQPKQPVKFILNSDGQIEIIGIPELTEAERAERKARSAKCGHVKRRLVRNEPLTGDLLEFALGIVEPGGDIAAKLKAGQTLSPYELHLVIDVFLLHARLSA